MMKPLKTLRARLLAAALLMPAALLGTAGLAQAQTIDLLVNHEAVPVSATGPAGGDFSYVPIVILNSGTQATVVELTQELPVGVTLNSITFDPVGGNTCGVSSFPVEITAGNKTITCSLDDITASGLSNGIATSFNVTIPTANTNWLATASAESNESDSDPSNNLGLERNITTTEAADLAIALNGPSGTITQFTPFDYRAVVTNHGPSDLPGKAQVTFTVPAGTSVSNAGGTGGWTCSPASGPDGTELTCEHAGPVSVDTTLSDLVFTTTATSSGEIVAAASVRGYEADGSTEFPDAVDSNNTASLSIQIDADNVVDVGIAKSVSPTIVDASLGANPVTYTITPSRLGGAEAPTNVQVIDTLPNGVTVTGTLPSDSDWTCAEASSKITCDYNGAVPAVGSNYPPISFTANVDGGAAPAATTNTATVSAGNEHTGATGNNSASATVTVSNEVSLTLSKTASQSPIQSGQPFDYNLTVRNNGNLDVLSGQVITLVDSIPDGIEVTGFSGTNWSCTPATATGAADITCTYSAGLAKSASTTLTLNAVGTFSGTGSFVALVNTASVNGVSGRDGFTPISSSATVNVSEHEVALGITKQANPTSVKSGDEVTYTITVTNEDSANPSTGIRVTDVLNRLVTSKDACTYDVNGNCTGDGPWPNGGLTVGDISISGGTGGSCTANGNKNSRSRTVTCEFDQIDANESAIITIPVRHFAQDGAQNETVENTASVRSTEVAYGGDNPSATTEVTVSPVADIQVFKEPTPDPAAVGEPVTYTVHVRNAGPSYAANVHLEDVLPDNAHWIAGSLSATGTCYDDGSTESPKGAIADDATGATLACDWTSTAGELSTQLAPNAQYAVKYKLRSVHDAAADDVLRNPVDVTTTTEETTLDNNHAEASVTLSRAALDVLINMQHTADGLVLGEETEYTITVTNNGPSYATDVTMTDLFPGELDIGGTNYPSSATFSWQDDLSVESSLHGVLTPADVCVAPAVGDTAGPLVCSFDKLAPGETVTMKFRMAADALPEGRDVGTIFHNAQVTLFETEWLPDGSDVLANNTTSDRTSARRDADTPTPEVADLGVVKTASASVDQDSEPLEAGESLDYTLTVTNHGPAQSTLGQLSDVLPEGLDFVSASGACDFVETSRALQCGVGTLDAGDSVTFTVQTTLEDDYRGPTQLTNAARVHGPGDPNPDNDQDEVETRVKSLAAVPTLAEWTLLLMMLMLAGLGASRLRRASRNR